MQHTIKEGETNTTSLALFKSFSANADSIKEKL